MANMTFGVNIIPKDNTLSLGTSQNKWKINGVDDPKLTDTTYSNATTSADGLMSATDKAKLDGIASGAQVNSITGIKGDAESSYRTGNVNLTPANIGAPTTTGSGASGTWNISIPFQGYGWTGFKNFGLNDINIDTTRGNWEVGISERENRGTFPSWGGWCHVAQYDCDHFVYQVANCVDSNNAKVSNLSVRSKWWYAETWGAWTDILYNNSTVPVTSGGTGATTPAQACANIGAVAKSGDTMTGPLTVPQIYSANAAYPAYSFANAQNTQVADIYYDIGSKSFVFRYDPNGQEEHYVLPTSTGSGGHYILTDKSPVLVTQGGTGATTPAQARTNLEITPANIGAVSTSDVIDVAHGGTGANSATGARQNFFPDDLSNESVAYMAGFTGGWAKGGWLQLPLPLPCGGTEATTAAGARANLGVPSTTGSGASGTWGINISGNAATATSSTCVSSSGFQTSCLSYRQSDDTFFGSAQGWEHFIICNHGAGETYYNYTIGLPFGGKPQYKRQDGSQSAQSPWYEFLTTESPVLVTEGGTGATTWNGARENLGVIARTESVWFDANGWGTLNTPNGFTPFAAILDQNWFITVHPPNQIMAHSMNRFNDVIQDTTLPVSILYAKLA